MFSYFGGGYSSYGRGRGDSSDEEEGPSSGFRLQRGEGGVAAAGASSGTTALAAALDGEANPDDAHIALETEADGADVDALVAEQQKDLCVECQDQPGVVTCVQCQDVMCDVCFRAMHKAGSRAKHTTVPYAAGRKLDAAVSSVSAASAAAMEEDDAVPPAAASASSASAASASAAAADDVTDDMLEEQFQKGASGASASAAGARSATSALSDDDDDDDDNASHASGASAASAASRAAPIVLPSRDMNSSLVTSSGRLLSNGLPADWFTERSKYIPLRLTMEERKYLRLLEATLNVSEYTDKVDIISSKQKTLRIKEQLRDLCSILSGLVVANDYKLGQQLLKDKAFEDNEEFFHNVFELGRRHKIRNPEKMRSTYGKLTYIVQDSVDSTIRDMMGFHLYAPLKTVYRALEAAGALGVLQDEYMMLATGDIKTEGRQRPEIERDIKRKEAALAHLARKYANAKIDEEHMRACILSVADVSHKSTGAHACAHLALLTVAFVSAAFAVLLMCQNHTFLIQNRHCCDEMLKWLTELYNPSEAASPSQSLAILGGRAGARLTHSHANQYAYVMQSLTLWRETLHDMFRLWVCTEEDLFDAQNPYRLRNTGQGLNRVQAAPRVGKAMHNILHHCQRKLGHWVGSSVIHLGDHNVPNALSFIDKYTQVSRILNPIMLTLKALPRLAQKPDVKFYIDKVFGGVQSLHMLILTDFFRHGFDGSGAENFFDAGSCIDGRLTSAWNWCNKLEKKSYYTIFQLAGFSSFDGQWSD